MCYNSSIIKLKHKACIDCSIKKHDDYKVNKALKLNRAIIKMF